MLLEVDQVRGGYGGKDVVKGVSCSADAGEVLCLLGPNGCGKTTLFRLLLGLLPITGGSIRLDGQDVRSFSPRELASRIAYIPQYHTPVFSYTVLDVVLMGRSAHFSTFRAPKEADRAAAFAALEKLNAAHLANRKYTALSGGQRQLVLLSWMNRPPTWTTPTTSCSWRWWPTWRRRDTASSCPPTAPSAPPPSAARCC